MEIDETRAARIGAQILGRAPVDPATIAPDPANSNMIRAAQAVSEITWRYLQTHTAEEYAALLLRIDEKRRIRERLFGDAIPVIVADKTA